MRKHLKSMVTFSIPMFAVSAVYFVIVYRMTHARPGKLEGTGNLTVRYTDAPIPLDPRADFWTQIEAEKIHLFPQSARVPYGNEERDIWVRAVFNASEIAFLIELEDDTENRGAPENPDACAILFVPGDSPPTSQMMGYGSRANVWQWLADRDAERHQRGNTAVQAVRELVASGPGTQTPMERQHVEGKGIYRDGRWTVVFKRRLDSRQDDEFAFDVGSHMKIAFAQWDGAKMESFSRKSIAVLRTLTLEKP